MTATNPDLLSTLPPLPFESDAFMVRITTTILLPAFPTVSLTLGQTNTLFKEGGSTQPELVLSETPDDVTVAAAAARRLKQALTSSAGSRGGNSRNKDL